MSNNNTACYGCAALYKSLFCQDQIGGKFLLFNKQSTKERVNEVRSKLNELWGEWLPYQTNGFELYGKSGNDWSKVNISEMQRVDWYASWKGMPKESITYLASLPEFDAKLFKEITGLDADRNTGRNDVLDSIDASADRFFGRGRCEQCGGKGFIANGHFDSDTGLEEIPCPGCKDSSSSPGKQ